MRGRRHGAGVKDRNDELDPVFVFTFPHVFSNDFKTKFIGRAARGKGRARGSQSGDIWTREETREEVVLLINHLRRVSMST